MKPLKRLANPWWPALAALAALLTNPAAKAGPITWGAPTTCAGDTDVLNNWVGQYAWDWGMAQTVNGVTFAASTSPTNAGINITLGFNSYNGTSLTNTSPASPFNTLSSAYKGMLTGSAYKDATGVSVPVTLNNLTNGLNYAVQFWVSDPRGKNRAETLTSTGGNTVTLNYSSTGSTAGGLGTYSVGVFSATATNQSFTVTTTGSGDVQINALQLRLDPLGFWNGAVNGAWDGTTTNFTGGLSFSAVAGQGGEVWFADTDGLNNPVTNTNITVQTGGVAIGSVNFLNNALNYVFQNAGGTGAGISGATAVNKTGTGVVTFAGAETYTGGTTISAGTLALGVGGSLPGTTNINVAAGATLDVSAAGGFALGSSQSLAGGGGINGNVSASAGAQIIPGGAGTIGTLTFSNNLTLNGLSQNFAWSASSNDLLQVMGTLTNNGTVMIGIYPPPSAGTYTLFRYAALAGAGTFVLSNTTPRNVTLNVGATAVTITVAGSPGNLSWKGDGTANTWDLEATTNWLNAGTPDAYYQGDNVTFDSTGTNLPAINLTTTLLPGSVTVNATPNYTFAGGGEISGPGSLILQGSGTLILDNTGSNDFTGGIAINGGALQSGNGDARGNLPAGNIVNSGILIFDRSDSPTVASAISGSGMVVQNGGGTTIFPGANTYSGGTTVSNGTLQLNIGAAGGTGPIVVNAGATLALSDNSGQAYNNAISGAGTINIFGGASFYYAQVSGSMAAFTGTINIGFNGEGEFVDRSNNQFLNGGVTVNVTNGGVLFIKSAGANACRINLAGLGDGNGLGALDDNGGAGSVSGPVTLLSNTAIAANSGEITGVISDGGNGYGFTKLDVGILTLSAPNTYSGGTVISNGTVLLNTFGSISNSPVIRLAGGTFNVAAVNGGFSLNTGQTLSGSGKVSGGFNAPAGSQVIPGGIGAGGALVFSNGLTLNGQTMAFDLGATPASASNDLVNVLGSPLTLNGNSPISLNYLAGSVTPGVYTLFSYPSLAGAGTFTLASAYPNVTLTVGAAATTITVGNGAVSLVWKGDGTTNKWDLAATNWLNGGVASVFSQTNNVTFTDAGSNTPAINLATNLLPSTMTINATKNYAFSGPGSLAGGASLTILNTGTLTLNNSNSYTGGTYIDNGALQLGANGSAGSVAGLITDNASLVLDHGDTNTVANAISGTGSLVVNGTGLEILATSNSYAGGTTNNGDLQFNDPNAAGTGPIVNNGTINLLSGGYRWANTFSGSGVINIVPTESAFNSGNTAADFAQFDGVLNGNATVNVPVGPGVARVETYAANGTANNFTFNITNNGQLYLKGTTLTATVNVAGTGYGDGLGAIRWASGTTLGGTMNLTASATLAGPGTFTGTIDDNGSGCALTVCAYVVTLSGVTSANFGDTSVTNGATLALTDETAIENSPAINIGAGSIFDVSGEGLTYPVPTGVPGAATTQTLAGAGENGIIVGNIALGSGGSLAATISNDGNPSLTVTNGTLSLSDNPVTVTIHGSPLTGGTYPLVAIATNGVAGAVAGEVSSSPLTVAGSGLAAGATGSLLITNSALYLVVSQPAPAPAVFNGLSVLPAHGGCQMVFSGNNGHGYAVLATTNLALPFASWETLASGTFGAGPVTNTDLTATNCVQRYYDILSY